MTHNTSTPKQLTVTVDARPQPIALPLSKTAILVVDMQNDFGSNGGLFHRAGIDLSGIRATIPPIARLLKCGRSVGLPIIFIKIGFRPDLSDLYQPGPIRDRWLAYGIGAPAQSPDGKESRVGIRDTWNTDVVDELKPLPGDIEVYKHGYSGFHGTELDAVLSGLGAKYLIVTGCTTSVCVESTIRDAHSRDYYCVLLEDCTAEPIGGGAKGYLGASGAGEAAGGSNYQATMVLMQTIVGWVSNSESVVAAFAGIHAHVMED